MKRFDSHVYKIDLTDKSALDVQWAVNRKSLPLITEVDSESLEAGELVMN